MAVLLTTEYQEVGRFSLDYADVIVYGKYTSQSQENNTTTYQLKSVYYNPSYNVSFDSASTGLDGTDKDYGATTFNRGQTTILEVTRTITHNEDGTSPTKYFGCWWWASYGGTGNVDCYVTFPNIQRYSIITNAPNFTDEENPTLTFTNTGMYNVRPMLYAVYNNNRVIISAGETLTNNETSYTFDLDEEAYMDSSHISQRNKLRQLCTGQSIVIIFAVQTSVSPTPYISTARANMNIVNATPTITSSATESNQKVITFLGSSSASNIIANASILHFAPTITTLKYATTSALNIVNSGLTYSKTSSPFEIDIPISTDNSFVLSVIDSRGFTTSTIDNQRTLLNYEVLKINSYSFVREAPTSNNIKLNLDCVYYSTIGNISNPVVVKWKLDDGSYNTIPSSSYVIDTTNHTLKINNYELTNALSYQSTGQFTIYIEDELTNTQEAGENGKVLKGVATFDAGEHDFQVNGDLYVADTNRQNAVNILSAISGAGDDIYSQSETLTHKKWIDNKPIYRKVIPFTLNNGANDQSITHNISNLGVVTFMYAFVKNNTSTNNESYPIPTLYRNMASDYAIAIYRIDKTSIVLTYGSFRGNSSNNGYVIVEYTKSN